MKKLLFAFVALLTITITNGQSKTFNDPNAQSRSVKDFHAIKVSNGIHLFLTQGNQVAIAVSALKTDYRDRIKTIVEDGVLKIYYDNDNWKLWSSDNKKLQVYVSCTTLDGLKASSGAWVDVDGSIKSGNLDLTFSSGAMFTGNINVSELSIDQGSGASSTIGGTATKIKVEASSGSVFKGYDLQANQCEAKVSSGGTVSITVLKELSASAHSGGQINYKGGAVIREISTGSGGAVSGSR